MTTAADHRADLRARAPLPYAEFVGLTALLMASTAFAIDVILPAMLVIGDELGAASENAAQWLITTYLLPYAFGQLLFGPLADRFGRKPVILFGLVIYAVASIASIFATSFAMLLAMRGLAGFGAASGRTAVVAIVRDCFSGRDMAAVMSIVMMVFMLIPILAPALGQALIWLSGWPAIFVFLAAFAIVLTIWVSLRLPETLADDQRRSLKLSSIAGAFGIVVSNRLALCYALAMSVFFASLFGFVNSAPQIYINIYELGGWFPFYFSAGAGFVAVASLMNSRIVHRFGMRRLSHAALLVFTALGGILLAECLILPQPTPLWLLFWGTTLMFFMFGFIGTNFNALAMEPLGAHAGMASAVFGFLQMGVAGSLGAVIGQFYNGTSVPLLAGFLLCGIASLGFVLIAERGRLMTEGG